MSQCVENAPILIGLGANLPSRRFGSPVETLTAALAAMESRGIRVIRRSPWFETEPVPVSDQPWYVNAVVSVLSSEKSDKILQYLHLIEDDFGRVRAERNAPRIIDLDLLAFADHVAAPQNTVKTPQNPLAHPLDTPQNALDARAILPHPRLGERGFVLLPLQTIAPYWRHPGTGLSVGEMIAALPQGPAVRLLRHASRNGDATQ